MSASLNRLAADRAEQIEEALVVIEIDKALAAYINGLGDRGHFDAVQVAPGNSGDIPDEAGGVRAVVLGVAHPHSGREGSEALKTTRDMLLHRGSTPRVYRNMLVFLTAEARQIDNLKDAMRGVLAWEGIVRDTLRLNLTQSDSALARDKAAEAKETMRTRLREAWCYLLYPAQDGAEAEVAWISGKAPVQDGILGRASKRLVDEEALLTEFGPGRLDRELQRYIWNGKDHVSLKDLWEYVNRYTYLPRLKNRSVLVKTIGSAVGGLLPGPFAYAESWDEATGNYRGLVIDNAGNVQIVIDSESVIVNPAVAEANRPAPPTRTEHRPGDTPPVDPAELPDKDADNPAQPPPAEVKPTRFIGTVMISADRPARDIHVIVEAVVEQLTTLPGSEVTLTLEIDAEVPSGLDRGKVRTLIENANTLDFIEKTIK